MRCICCRNWAMDCWLSLSYRRCIVLKRAHSLKQTIANPLQFEWMLVFAKVRCYFLSFCSSSTQKRWTQILLVYAPPVNSILLSLFLPIPQFFFLFNSFQVPLRSLQPLLQRIAQPPWNTLSKVSSFFLHFCHVFIVVSKTVEWRISAQFSSGYSAISI